MAAPANSRQQDLALFIDFENVAIAAEEHYGYLDLTPILEAVRPYGRCVIARVYGDWSRFGRYRQAFLEHDLDPVQLFRYTGSGSKNAADMVISLDALEVALEFPHIRTVVLVSGDSDFTPLVRRLRAYGKYVVGMGFRRTTGESLVHACDDFFYIDDLLASQADTPSQALERARHVLLSAMHRLAPRFVQGLVPASTLKLEMRRLDPEFDESTLGYVRFAHFLEAQSDLVVCHQTEDGYLVSLRGQLGDASEIDLELRYRMALASAGFRLPPASLRQELLRAAFRLLREYPGRWRLDDLMARLRSTAADTDAEVLREVARLLKLANVLSPSPQSWELDPLTLASDLGEETFVQRCESVYVGVLLQHHLPIQEAVIADLLYEGPEREEQVRHLVAWAQATRLVDTEAEKAVLDGYEWPRRLVESPEVRVVLRDLANMHLDQEPSLEEAVRLNAEGLRLRAGDFERAQVYFLRAARMMYELLRREEPGASWMDLEWYLASYTAAAAGAAFTRRDYATALAYYRAFLALVKETEPVWDRVRKAVPPMLSFYFTLAANEYNETLPISPGRTHPARLAVLLYTHPNPQVRVRWLALAQDLLRINPTLLRTVVQRLALLEEEGQAGARETREALLHMIQAGSMENVSGGQVSTSEAPEVTPATK